MASFMQEVSTLESWVLVRAENSFQPSRYMNLFEAALRKLMKGHRLDEEPMDLSDTVRAAAEIEALCAHRSLMLYQQAAREQFEEVIREVIQPRAWEPKKDSRRDRTRGPDGRYAVEQPT